MIFYSIVFFKLVKIFVNILLENLSEFSNLKFENCLLNFAIFLLKIAFAVSLTF